MFGHRWASVLIENQVLIQRSGQPHLKIMQTKKFGVPQFAEI